MKVWGLWYGGVNYSIPTFADLEAFASMREATKAFSRRADGFDRKYPCVDKTTEMHLYFKNPREMRDPYPDRVLKLGPRCTVRCEKL